MRPNSGETFTPLPDRDASAAIRGYIYQAQRTVLAWIDLDEQTVLYCESGEDIDFVSLPDDEASPDPLVLRLLEQVKFRGSGSLTLRSDEAMQSLSNFLSTREMNPGLTIQFRYFTNAIPSKEQGIEFPGGVPGIEAWEQVRRVLSELRAWAG